ncbi:50S ribosomal protein L11 methyltransferase [Amycolatopsis panacis]|uniref:SAM-dependent methyltransferase n=1 Tax=Amycolatopsis panacis TaxID=2340917 RepID=A0A419I1R1_9PSEU|nr:50S ribosomal protein L11 methyltransferase [Amycolatopsis panacis]RJQ83718.1 SAM-dependent methyltransferase [Amycolatopsis panacis]
MQDNEVRTIMAGTGEVDVAVYRDWEKAGFFMLPSVGEYPVYDGMLYEYMIDDKIRTETYRTAVRRLAPGRTVLDIGTGADAIWAIESAQAGARHVYAMEVIPESAQQARAAVEKAGLTDRITILEGLSTELSLPERVDLCVSEIIGTISSSEGVAPVLRDARERFLKRDGWFIPHRSASTVAAVDLNRLPTPCRPALVEGCEGWLQNIFTSVGRPFDVRMCIFGITESTLLTEQAEVEVLEFNGELAESGTDHFELEVTTAGRLHGFALGVRLWVDETDGAIDSIQELTNWSPLYAPISREGIEVRPGDRIPLTFTRTTSDDGVHPDYRLAGELQRTDGTTVTLEWDSPHHTAGFRGDDFYRELFPIPE